MRHDRNGIFTDQDMSIIKNAKVCVVGCGGLGGYVIEMLARAGIGSLTVVDGDVFDESNLNRQVLSDTYNIGLSKAKIAVSRVKRLDPDVEIRGLETFLSKDNIAEIVEGHDIVVDALDSIDIRFVIQAYCKESEIPMVHGAIAGWYGQVSTIMPGDDTLNYLYRGQNKGVEQEIGNPSFTPATIASIQVAEVFKVLLNKSDILSKKVLFVDLLASEFELVEF